MGRSYTRTGQEVEALIPSDVLYKRLDDIAKDTEYYRVYYKGKPLMLPSGKTTWLRAKDAKYAIYWHLKEQIMEIRKYLESRGMPPELARREALDTVGRLFKYTLDIRKEHDELEQDL